MDARLLLSVFVSLDPQAWGFDVAIPIEKFHQSVLAIDGLNNARLVDNAFIHAASWDDSNFSVDVQLVDTETFASLKSILNLHGAEGVCWKLFDLEKACDVPQDEAKQLAGSVLDTLVEAFRAELKESLKDTK